MACSADPKSHDIRFVYVQPDDVARTVIWEDDSRPTVYEARTAVMECILCLRQIRTEKGTTVTRPEPDRYDYRAGEPPRPIWEGINE